MPLTSKYASTGHTQSDVARKTKPILMNEKFTYFSLFNKPYCFNPLKSHIFLWNDRDDANSVNHRIIKIGLILEASHLATWQLSC